MANLPSSSSRPTNMSVFGISSGLRFRVSLTIFWRYLPTMTISGDWRGVCEIRTAVRISQTPLQSPEIVIVGRYRQKMVSETRNRKPLEMPKTLIFVGREDDDGRLAMLGYGLRPAPSRLDDLAEPVLGILD